MYFFLFLKALFSQDNIFLSVTKKKKLDIKLVNIQKILFLFPLEELHFI